MRDFNKVIANDATNTKAFYYRGIAKRGQKSYPNAISDFTRAIQPDSSLKRAYLERGIAKHLMNDDSGACEDFRKCSQSGIEEAKDDLDKWCK